MSTQTITMKLILEHCKNPDVRGGYRDMPVDPKRIEVEVTDLLDARKKFIAWRERNHLGGGNITKRSGTVMQGKAIVARISYNGRAWAPDGTEIRLNPTDVLACEEDWNAKAA